MTTHLYRYRKILRWTLVFACTAYIIRFFIKNVDDFKLLAKLQPGTILAIAALLVLGHVFFCFRFQMVLKKCSGTSVPFFHWFRIMIRGRFLTLLAPQAGNIYRSIALKKHYRIPHTRYASSFFSFVWMDACVNLILAILIVLIVQPKLTIGDIAAVYLLAGLFVVILVAPILTEVVLRLVKFRNERLSWLHGRLSEMFSVSVANLRDGVFMLKFLLMGMVVFVDAIAIFFLCFRAMDMSINLPALALFYVVLRLSTFIIITPGNLGVREIAYGIISEQMKFGMAQGILISIIIRIIGTTVIIILGTLFGGIGLLRHKDDYLQATRKKETFVDRIPFVSSVARRISALLKRITFRNSNLYWKSRYSKGGLSGGGSYGKLAEFKAGVLNSFVREKNVQSVIEFGCGDGHQLSLSSYPSYVGLDISPAALQMCNDIFKNDKTKSFFLYESNSFMDNDPAFKADLALSLDVIYHLVENSTFEVYMQHLFASSKKFIIIYSNDTDKNKIFGYPHIKCRKFSDWIIQNAPEWRLIKRIPNKYPYEGPGKSGSWCDFFIYEKANA